ncbi:MAG: Ada metal-binding domain-containing protein [Verrucomicrobiota bacterium]
MKTLLAVAGLGFASLVAAASAPSSSGYHGSAKSNVYHLPSCATAKKILKENLLVFATKEEAAKKNYRPCKVCKP